MVKSYQRFEQSAVFGLISTSSQSVYLPANNSTSGKLITGALENLEIWTLKTNEVEVMSDGLPIGAVDSKLARPAVVTAMCFHKETGLLCVGYDDGVIKVWDLLSKSVLMQFNGHNSGITVLRLDSEGTRLVSGSKDSDLIIWDLVGEVGLMKLRSHKDAITGVWVDEKMDWLVSVAKDGLIKVWDLKAGGQCIETHMAHTGQCWSMAVNEEVIITTSMDSQVKVWELDLEKPNGNKVVERGSFETESKQRGVATDFITAPNGTRFFFVQNNDKTVEIFRIRPSDEVSKALKKREKRLRDKGASEEEIQEAINPNDVGVLFHPFSTIRSAYKVKSTNWIHASNSKLELVLTTSNNTIETYQVAYAKRDAEPPVKRYNVELQGHRTDIRSMDTSDDGKLLSTASNGELKVWNLTTKKCIRTFACGYALCSKLLPGGTLVVVGTRQGEIQLFDLASSTLLTTIEAHSAAIWSLDLTSNGKRLVTGSSDKSCKFWDFEVIQQLVPGTKDKYLPQLNLIHDTTLELTDDILSVKISPDDRYLAVSLLDNTVKVFFLDSLKFYLSLYGHKLPVLSIDISVDSKMIITSSADKNIKIWGLDFGDCHKSIFAHQDSIMSVKFEADTHNFFSCGKDGVVKRWDGDKFDCIQKLNGHQSEVWCIAVSRDGRTVVSTSHDHSIRVWQETDDQVFLEEEKEREMEEEYEETLLKSLEGGSGDDQFLKDKKSTEDGSLDEVTGVNKQTLESLKAGERLMEALDLGVAEIESWEAYGKQLKTWKKKKSGEAPVKPQGNAILIAMKTKPEKYILDTLAKIKPSQLEDSLLVLPFSYVIKFFKFFDVIMLQKDLVLSHLSLVCKILFFIVRNNNKELVAQKNEELKQRIERVKNSIRSMLQKNADDLGFNIAGLKFIKQQWNLRHNLEFTDDYEQLEHEKKTAKKRVFETVR